MITVAQDYGKANVISLNPAHKAIGDEFALHNPDSLSCPDSSYHVVTAIHMEK